ncbi:hypothetical protein BH10PSE5_BH10PSE5_08630 [soil metagenome]
MFSSVRALARVAPFSALFITLAPAAGDAACIGCTPQDGPGSMVCTASCLSEGYRLTVVKTIPGGPSLPPGCSGSASGAYLVLESIEKVRNYSATEYVAAHIQPSNQVSVAVKSPMANELMCNVEGATLNAPVYQVTSVHFGPTHCIPAHDISLDCGGVATMAANYNSRSGRPPLDVCRDGCNGYSATGSGGSKWIGSLSPGHSVLYDPNLPADPNAALKVPAKKVPVEKARAKPR